MVCVSRIIPESWFVSHETFYLLILKSYIVILKSYIKMCGIAGAYSFKNKIVEQQWLQNTATSLNKRGPDNQNFVTIGKASLVHARLSIIDTSTAANQPIYDSTERYSI
ncbi:MAG TPA: hypothetical protein PKZ14_04470, partial [Chitinophagales bacterium]|nr:hypothetical protein [Chitinophagales bacterium]